VLPLVGTVEQLDNGDIELVINVDPQQNADSYPIDGVLTPEIPFELPTLSSDTAGVLITLTPDLISSDVTYALSLIVTGTPTPCVPDLLDDGVLDIFDVFAFLDLFNAGDTAADFTGDGTLDIFDVFAFLDAFNAGCP